MARFWWQYLKSDVNTLMMLIGGALPFAASANYLGLQFRRFVHHRAEELGDTSIHLLRVALSLCDECSFNKCNCAHMGARACLSAIWVAMSDSFSLSICRCLLSQKPFLRHSSIFCSHWTLHMGNIRNRSFVSNENGTCLLIGRFLRYLTHWGRVTQICVFTLQLCKTDDANLRF